MNVYNNTDRIPTMNSNAGDKKVIARKGISSSKNVHKFTLAKGEDRPCFRSMRFDDAPKFVENIETRSMRFDDAPKFVENIERHTSDIKKNSNINHKSNWILSDECLQSIPSHYPLEKSFVTVYGTNTSNITSRISECSRIMSVQAIFDANVSSASLVTAEHIEIYVSLWKGFNDNGIIVEVQRRKGCAVIYHKYCRKILDAAEGLFDEEAYTKQVAHNLFFYSKGVERVINDIATAEAERQHSLLTLDIAANLIKKDRMDAQQLGMESLCLLTDPRKTCKETVLLTSQIILQGSVDHRSDEYECFYGIREVVMSLIKCGKLNGDDRYDNGECKDSMHMCPEELDNKNMLHYLALAVLANALDVLKLEDEPKCRTITNKFLKSPEIPMGEIITKLLSILSAAASKPHDAYLSARSLLSLFQISKEARKKAQCLQGKQIVLVALEVGKRTHANLENQSKKINAELEKEDSKD